MFTVAILQLATVKPPNIITHEKSFQFHAQPQTGAYSCYSLAEQYLLDYSNLYPSHITQK